MESRDEKTDTSDKMEIENDVLSLDFKKSNLSTQEDTRKNDEFNPKPNEFFEDFRIREAITRQFTKSQNERIDHFNAQRIEPSKIKEIAANVLPGVSMGKACKRILSSVAKTYAGELVEEAKKVMLERGDKGAIAPIHLREAYRRFQNKGKNYRTYDNDKFFM